MAGRLIAPLFEVLVEMLAAEKKHGENYMGNLPDLDPKSDSSYRDFLGVVSSVGRAAKRYCDQDKLPVPQMAVLMEELGEVADDILGGKNSDVELTQVAAMALAWLDVDARAAKERLVSGDEGGDAQDA